MEPAQTKTYLQVFLQKGIAELERVYEVAVKEKGVSESIVSSDEVETECITESVVMNSGLMAEFMDNQETFERLFPSVVKESTFVRTSRSEKTQSLTVDRKVSSVVVKGCLRALNPAVAVKNFHVKRVITRTGEGDDDWMILDVEMEITAPNRNYLSGLVVKRVSDAESTVTWMVQRPRIVVEEAYDRLVSTVYGPSRWVYALKREAERRSVLGFDWNLNDNLKELLEKGDWNSRRRKLFEILSVGPSETRVHSRCIGSDFASVISTKVEAPYTHVFQACKDYFLETLGVLDTESRLPSPVGMSNYVASFRTELATRTMFETYNDAAESVIMAAPYGDPLTGFTMYPVPPFCFVTSFLMVDDHADAKSYTDAKTFSEWKAKSETIVGQMISYVVNKVVKDKDKVNPNPNVEVDVV